MSDHKQSKCEVLHTVGLYTPTRTEIEFFLKKKLAVPPIHSIISTITGHLSWADTRIKLFPEYQFHDVPR